VQGSSSEKPRLGAKVHSPNRRLRRVGAVLSQQNEQGEEDPVAYFSKKLLPREEKYATLEKECLAIKLAIHNFRSYLLGKQFTVQTDHRALEWLHRSKENNHRLVGVCSYSHMTLPYATALARQTVMPMPFPGETETRQSIFAAGGEGRSVRG